MKVFYHVDNDGKCSAACIRLFYQKKSDYDASSIEYFPINYGWDFPFEKINQDELVYIVDFSIEPEDMTKLLSITNNVIWIDHHISAIRKYDDFNTNISGLRVNGIAGCMLTYCYLFEMNGDKSFDISMTNNAPKFVKYIADRDVWKFEYGETTKYFSLGLDCEKNDPEDFIWDQLFDSDDNELMTHLINNGKSIKKYKDNYFSRYVNSKGFETELSGYSAYAVNISPGFASSEIFDDIDKTKYDIFVIFAFNGIDWSYTIYSDKIDVSLIASSYGGGGHKGAAGFHSEMLLLKENDSDENVAHIICAHPCSGKSTAAANLQKLGYRVIDLDYTNFSTTRRHFKRKSGNVPIVCDVKNINFPYNLIQYIKEMRKITDFIFLSSDEEVRNALNDANIKYTLVFPRKEDKLSYNKRFLDCRYSEEEIRKLNYTWDVYMNSYKQDNSKKIILKNGLYLTNVINSIC